MKKQTLVSSELRATFLQTVSQLTLETATTAMSREERGLCRWHHCDNQCLRASEQHHVDGSHGEGLRQHTKMHTHAYIYIYPAIYIQLHQILFAPDPEECQVPVEG